MLYESGAIVEYIIARYSDGALKPAGDSPLFPEYLQWFHYCEGMAMPPVNTIVVQTILLQMSRRPAGVGEDRANLNAYIDRIEARPAFQKGIQA